MAKTKTQVETNQEDSLFPADYKVPKSAGKYLKLTKVEDELKFRLIQKPVVGWEGWRDKKPLRFKTFEETKGLKFDGSQYNPKGDPVHFWAFTIWNFKEERIQVLTITQSSVMNRLTQLNQDPDWGSLLNYDIKVIKEGKGKETKYIINPLPQKPVPDAALKALAEKPVDLNELFTGGDPFGDSEASPSDVEDDF